MLSIAFVLKKAVSHFLYPLGAALMLACVGLLLWRFKSRSSIWIHLVAISVFTILVISWPLTAFVLLRSLEGRAGGYADPKDLISHKVKYIVVLGGAGKLPGFSPADRTGASVFRVLEGIRLEKAVPGSKIFMSGMGFPQETNNPDLMKEFPVSLGVAPESVIAVAQAWDTADEAKLVSELAPGEPFALVTSAYHIPRAMQLFQAQGLRPMAAPCEFRARNWPPWYKWFLPDAEALGSSQLVIHEYFGLLWHSVRNASNSGYSALMQRTIEQK